MLQTASKTAKSQAIPYSITKPFLESILAYFKKHNSAICALNIIKKLNEIRVITFNTYELISQIHY